MCTAGASPRPSSSRAVLSGIDRRLTDLWDRFIAQARGECQYFGPETIPAAGEGCKSNALMRCCKDLGVASELWDPVYIRDFKKKHCHEVWVEHVATKKKRLIWLRKGLAPAYPYGIAKKTTATP